MSHKKAPLQAVLEKPKKQTPEKDSGNKKLQKVKVIYSISPAAKKQFDRLALDLELTKQDAFCEALNDFFLKNKKKPIA